MGPVYEIVHAESTENILSGDDDAEDRSGLGVQLSEHFSESCSTSDHSDVSHPSSIGSVESDSSPFSESVITGFHSAPGLRAGAISSSPVYTGYQPLVVSPFDSSCGGYDLTDEASELTFVGNTEFESANPSVEGIRGHADVDPHVS